MPVSLYNEEFEINDLIRAAHPGGGTTVIDVNSPSGGSGRVEDLIEQQLISIDRLVNRQPVVERLARLADVLDDEGLIRLSFDVTNMIKKAQDPPSIPDPGTSLLGGPILREREGEATIPEKNRLDLVWRKSLTLASRALNRLSNLQNTMEKMGDDIDQDDREDVAEAVNDLRTELAEVQISTRRGEYEGEAGYAEAARDLADTLKEVSDDIKKIKVRRVGYGEVGVTGLLREFITMERVGAIDLRKIDRDILAINRVGGALEQGSLDTAERVVGPIPDPGTDFDKPPKRTTDKPTPGTPDTTTVEDKPEGEKTIPSGRKPKGTPTRYSPKVSPAVQAIQIKHLGFKEGKEVPIATRADGLYGRSTNSALFRKLNELARGEGVVANNAKLLLTEGNGYFDLSNLAVSEANASTILGALEGRIDLATPSKRPKQKGISHINFTSPTGKRVRRFPIGSALKAGQNNPFDFVKLLQSGSYQALPVDVRADVLLASNLYDQLVTVISDTLEAEGDPNVNWADQLMREFKTMGAKLLGKKRTRMTTMQWISKAFPHEAEKIKTSTEAMNELISFLELKNISDVDNRGNINQRKANANKYYIRNVLDKVIRMHGLERAKGPAQPDPASAEAKGEVAVKAPNLEKMRKNFFLLGRAFAKGHVPSNFNIREHFERFKQLGYAGTPQQFMEDIKKSVKSYQDLEAKRKKLMQPSSVPTTPKSTPAATTPPPTPSSRQGLAGQQRVQKEFE